MTKTTDTPLLPCPHDLAERETACADGMCPLCLSERLSRVRPATDEGLLREAREALAKVCEVPDHMSFHGELIQCELCGGYGTRAGHKRGVGDRTVSRKPTCIIARLAQPQHPTLVVICNEVAR